MKEKNQQQLISFRVDGDLFKKFEALKLRFLGNDKKVSSSDLARSLIESTRDGQLEFGELLADQQNALENIQHLANTNQTLSLVQWEFLSYLVNRLYKEQGLGILQGAYLKVVIRAFEAWWNMALKYKLNLHERYFMSNLSRSQESENLSKKIQEVLNAIPEHIWSAEAEFASRNLNVVLRDDSQKIDPLDLHNTLKPYLPEILMLAKRAVYMETKEPFAFREPTLGFDAPLMPISSGKYSLMVNAANSDFSAAIYLPSHRCTYTVGSYMEFVELKNLIMNVDEYGPSLDGKRFSITGPFGTSFEYYLRNTGHQLEFNQEEFDDLKALVKKTSSAKQMQLIDRKMLAIYGDV